MEFNHKSVLLQEAVDGLNINPSGLYIDCTLGGGGHTQTILDHLSSSGKLISLDQDQQAIDYNLKKFKNEINQGRLEIIKTNFRHLDDVLKSKNILEVDGILYDLGVSSPQLDQAERGFSYHKDAPLDMRMNRDQILTAEIIVNEWSFNDLVRIFRRYGEEKYSKQIARKIEETRNDHRIVSTSELVELVKEGIPAPARRHGGHPAKRVFQAIRIAVNDELGAIEESLTQALEALAMNGRVSVISFHSLEDRIVKTLFKEVSTAPQVPKNLPILPKDIPQPDYQVITKKVITPSFDELDDNSRSKSAKLRIIERINQSTK